jgi:hypothetical protein
MILFPKVEVALEPPLLGFRDVDLESLESGMRGREREGRRREKEKEEEGRSRREQKGVKRKGEGEGGEEKNSRGVFAGTNFRTEFSLADEGPLAKKISRTGRRSGCNEEE